MTRIELSLSELVAVQYAAERVPDLDCRSRLRGIVKRADLAHRRGELGDQSLPNVGRIKDIVALIMPTPPIGSRPRTRR